MPIAFDCPHCGKNYRVADTNAGKRFACKECGNPVTVPGAQAAAAPARQAAPAQRPAGGNRPAPAQRPAPGNRPAAPQSAPPDGTPYGGQPATAQGPKTRAPNFVFLGGAAAMTIGFFLP